MSIKNKIVAAALSGLAIAGIVAAASLAFPRPTSAQTNTPTAPATTTATAPGGRGERSGLKGDIVSHDKYLADALDISEACPDTRHRGLSRIALTGRRRTCEQRLNFAQLFAEGRVLHRDLLMLWDGRRHHPIATQSRRCQY
jgi:hypothetical protein